MEMVCDPILAKFTKTAKKVLEDVPEEKILNFSKLGNVLSPYWRKPCLIGTFRLEVSDVYTSF